MCVQVARCRVRHKTRSIALIECAGLSVEVFDYIMRKAHIEYVRVPLGIVFNYGDEYENGTWSGYLGAVQQAQINA